MLPALNVEGTCLKMIDQLIIIVGLTILVMISPGPDMVIVARNTMLGDRGDGLLTSAGVLTGNLVHITYCAVGIGWLISQSILAFSVLKYAGAADLIYLGIMSIRAKATPLQSISTGTRSGGKGYFLQGFLNNILNPKGPLFYLGVFTVVIDPQTSIGETIGLVITIMLVSAAFWLLFVFTLDRNVVREFFDKSQKAVNRIFGALLIVLGIRVAFLER